MRYTPTNITTAVMLALTLWLLVGRFRARSHSSWPLIYYAVLVAYHQALPGRLNPYAIYTAVIAALFLRFEFMTGWLAYILQGAEMAVLLYLAYRMFSMVTL